MIKIRLKPLKEGKKSLNKHANTTKSALKEVTEEELEHIGAAALLEPEDLAFSSLFGDKRRIIIDFEQFSLETDLGKFVKMFDDMGYTTDWDKGTLFGAREMQDLSPAAIASRIIDDPSDFGKPKPRKIHMKIGKWLKKTSEYVLKLDDLNEKIGKFHDYDIEFGRITGNQAKAALNDEELTAYYRNYSLLNMMADPLTEHFRKKPYELQNWGSWWQANAASLKKELKDSFHNDDVIIITRHPIDVFRMADFKNIESCHSPPSRYGHMTQQYKCAVAEAHGHGAVAYVVDKSELLEVYGVNTLEGVERQIQDADHELFYDDERVNDGPVEPKYRVRLRQMRYYDDDDALNVSFGQGTEIAVPERRMYPQGLPGFVDRVVKWAREEQQDVMSRAPKKDGDALNMGRFIKFGGSYEDNEAGLLLADLFAGQFRQFEGLPLQVTDTEDELESTLTLDIVKATQNDLDRIEARYNKSFQHMRVNGSAWEDDDNVGIDLEVRMRLEWPVDEWKSLPKPAAMEGCVEELKHSGMAMREIEGVSTSDYLIADRSSIIGMGDEITAHIPIDPEIFSGPEKYMEYISFGSEGFANFCESLRGFDKMTAAAIKQYVDTYFKREGNIEGGGMITFGRDIENGEYRWTEWITEVSGDEYDGYDDITAEMTVAIPNIGEVQLPEGFGRQDFAAWVLENGRDINIELRKRIMAGPRETVGTEYYIPSLISKVNTSKAKNELYIKWQLELPYDVNDEMVELMKEIITEVTEEEVTETLGSVIEQLIKGQHLSEMKGRSANWALKRWKNNFV